MQAIWPKNHFLIPAEGRVQYLRHFWRSSQEAHVQSAPEIGPCDAAWLARDEMWKSFCRSKKKRVFWSLYKSNTCYISNSNSSTTSEKNAARILTRLSIINSRFILHTYDFSSTISRFESGKTKKKQRVFSTTGEDSRKCSHPKLQVFAGLCCCTLVGFNQGLIFEAMPMLYMASRKAPKTNTFPGDLGRYLCQNPTLQF